MDNNEIKHAMEFHEETKHSEMGLQTSRHYMDWDDRPRPFKVYADLPTVSLPDNFAIPSAEALACIRSTQEEIPSNKLNLQTLSQLLFFSAGITREMKFDTGTYYMRAASATGALYPIELYITCHDLSDDVPAGVYHFCPGDFSLSRLRAGDYRKHLAEMAGNSSDIAASPVTLIFTSLAWRNAWKYRARSYRHWFWDSGVIAANLLAVAASGGLKAKLLLGFVDEAVNSLLFLEGRTEAAIVLSPIIDATVASQESAAATKPSLPVAKPNSCFPKSFSISRNQAEYPEIWKIHHASSLRSAADVRTWLKPPTELICRSATRSEGQAISDERQISSMSDTVHANVHVGIGETILRRGSTRRFAQRSISKDQLLAVLNNSTRGVPLDFLKSSETLINVYLIANDVEGLSSGDYFYNIQSGSLEQLSIRGKTASRNESAYLCLGQSLFGDASAVLFLMTDLDSVLRRFGNRGYRACQFEAGVIAGKVYLCSYALGLGASGSTFFDDAVTITFSPHAQSKATMIAVGLGVPTYKAKPGRVLAVRLTRNQLIS